MGPIARISTALGGKDIWHDSKARWSSKRNNFRIATGIYAVGNPDKLSPVLVTANYKLTFDKLRKELHGLDLWLLVVDTRGINVWCSAGKGTFSAEEIINKIRQTGLNRIVSHRQLILPQLAASGVAAHTVTRATGFKVVYGPIYAKDIPSFLNHGCKATAEMRKVTFTLAERITLTPIELIMGLRFVPLIFILFGLINLVNNSLSWGQLLKVSAFNTIPYAAAIIIGTFLVPVLLPLLPFRSFALKGALAGVIWSLIVIGWGEVFMFSSSLMVRLANLLLITAIVSFLALNFTGSTPYTSFSGTQKETLKAVPVIITAALAGLILLLVGRFV